MKKRKAILISLGVLFFFIVLGELLLDAIEIPLPTFQIAGGLVLLLFALAMIFGESKIDDELGQINKKEDKAVFPLAIPSIASPGAILAVVLPTANEKNHIIDEAWVALIMVMVLVITWGLMMLSTKLFKFIGMSGAVIISRLMGLTLTSIAIDNILTGIKQVF